MLGDFTLKANRGFRHPWCLDEFTGCRGEPSKFELVNGLCRAALVHGLGQSLGCQIPAKFACFDGVAYTVLIADTRKADDRWPIIKQVEKTIRGQIKHPLLAAGTNPADHAWANNGIHRVVGESMTIYRLIKMYCHCGWLSCVVLLYKIAQDRVTLIVSLDYWLFDVHS